MIRVACLLLLTARALAASAGLPPHSRSDSATPRPVRAPLDYDDQPDLLIRTMWKFKRNAPVEATDTDRDNRKQFTVKSLCRMDDKKCAYTQVYEFDLLRVEPGVSGNGVYY